MVDVLVAVLVAYLDCSIVEVIVVTMMMMWQNEVMIAANEKRKNFLQSNISSVSVQPLFTCC